MSEFAAQTAQQKSLATMPGGGILQRKCACGQHKPAGGECAECKKKRRSLQRYPVSRAEPIRVPSIVHEVLRSPGQPLDVGTRESMEQRFAQDFCRVRTHTTRPQMAASGLKVGPANDRFEQEADYLAEKVIRSAPFGTSAQATGVMKPDFSQVRVHTGAKAVESAHSVNALAYTVGRDVVFGAGQYAPQASEGKRLLAHELTHVLQQASRKDPGSSRSLQRRRGSRGAATTPGQRLEFHPAMHPSLLGGPCACLVFIHNNERNARSAAEDLHRNCRYNLAIIGPGRSRNVPVRGGNGQKDPNELFPADIQQECTRDEAGCVAYESSHDDLRAMQIQFFLTIKACSDNFQLPTIALHNNSLSDTRSFLRTTSAAERERLRGDFSRQTGEGIGSRQDLRRRLGRRRGILSRSGTTNIFRWCNLPEISRCHVGDPHHPDDVIWVTNVQDYETLRQEEVNVVLQAGLGTTSGSESETDLSTLFLRLGPDARFINIETPITPQNQATRARNMSVIQQALEHIGLNCCESIGDFPTPSRTEMYA
jgi:hypothetical protein